MKKKQPQSQVTVVKQLIAKHRLQILVFVAGFLIIFLRRPDALLTPQFWAEDGVAFFAVAYNHSFGLGTLFMPYAGYFQLFPRALSLLGSLIGLKYMPFVFTVFAISFQVLPLMYLWSERFGEIVKTNKLRILISIIYLCLPYTQEISSNATNSQWYLAIAAFLIICITESKSRITKFFDYLVLTLAGLSGPFSILLAPIAFLEWFRLRRKENLVRLSIIVGCALLNIVNILFIDNSVRGSAYLGASLSKFLDIMGAQVFTAGLFGYKSSAWVLNNSWLAPAIAVVGIAMMGYALLRSPRQLRLFILFGLLIFFAALFFPTSSNSSTGLWSIFLEKGATGRYFFILHMALFLILIWLIKSRTILRAAPAVLLILSFIIGLPADFKYPAIRDLHFQTYAQKLNLLHPGQTERIPINPDPAWDITLTKH